MEIVGRAALIFLVLYAMLRVMGKRELGQMTPFELLALVIIGDLVEQAITHQDHSMTAAILAALTFTGLSLAFNWLSHRFPALRKPLEGEPVVLLQGGKPVTRNMDRERVDEDELASEMRLAGIARFDQVAWAILEPEGKISFIRQDGGDTDPRTGAGDKRS